MIGHWLLQLSPASEHEILTKPMAPTYLTTCVVGRAGGYTEGVKFTIPIPVWRGWRLSDHFVTENDPTSGWPRAARFQGIGDAYNALCKRFGIARVNHAIRLRVLSNQAARALAPAYAEV